MPHWARLVDNLGVIVVHYWGDISYAELQQVFDELPDMPGFRPGLKAIADFRGTTTKLRGADIQNLVNYAKNAEAQWGDSKWAILASTDLIYGLSRIYTTLTSEHEVVSHVFRSPKEANDWLGLGVDVSDILEKLPQ